MPDSLPPAGVVNPFVTLEAVRERVSGAVLARAGFNDADLNAWLRQRLAGAPEAGGLIGESVIEGAAPYEEAPESWADLRGTLLSAMTVDALTAGAEGEDYRFAPERHPFRHQHAAFTHLTAPDPRSVLVSSGTGSGKTECFLVPLLDDLAREAARTSERLSGVRAIMLYPLNALIASQQERLRRWTVPFKGRIRFGLYNGQMLDSLRAHDLARESAKHPEEVMDRKTLRGEPPPILVTNITMLEYMTIRREDRPLVRNSSGLLRWIVIDEAHSYVGSAAAEIALLLRRVLLTFNVAPKDVRFVATSATLGGQGEAADRNLRRFLADLAGVDESQVHVVRGQRGKVALPAPSLAGRLAGLHDRDLLARDPCVQAFIRATEAGPVPLTRVREMLAPTGQDPLAVMEAVAEDRTGGAPLLPLRVHQFMRAVPGLWSCLNPACGGARPATWPYGALAFERNDRCGRCESPLFEIVSCYACGEAYLQAWDDGARLHPQESRPDADDFAATRESEGIEDDEGEAAPTNAPPPRFRLIATREGVGTRRIAVDPTTGTLPERHDLGMPIPVTLPGADLSRCPVCRAQQDHWRPFRFGAPFLIGNATPVVLDGMAPESQKDGVLPAAGRRLLSFTDSRQGTARFAANIETNAERGYLRGYLYHLVQKSALPKAEDVEEIARLQAEVATLQGAVQGSPILADMVRKSEQKIEVLTSGSMEGIAWPKIRQSLGQDSIVRNWLRTVWRDRDARFDAPDEAFAEFLMLRELARRPRYANALETLGLTRLRFDRIDRLSPARTPDPLRQRGLDIAAWRDFLYVLLDTSVRGRFALQVALADVRWLLPRGGRQRNITAPRQEKRDKADMAWPYARSGGVKTNAVMWLEKCLDLDAEDGADRAQINEVLEAAWDDLRPLFESAGAERALDLGQASLAPVRDAWLCPVTRRVLTRRVFGRTPYGHREASPLADQPLVALRFPALPLAFPRSDADHAALAAWLRDDPDVARLRAQGVWNNLTDRAAMLAPYLRAEEHSAQQPPGRLRMFEDEFRRGEINLLACSTTMEMGIDIKSVSAVLMTNVPPSIVNYRQRAGRAGRRGQPFATALTYARATPLDRETFLDPARYMARELRPPRVKLESERIVRRHVNALLLANWMAEARGDLLKMRSGAFFGYADQPDQPLSAESPVDIFRDWLGDPGTRAAMEKRMRVLTNGTAITGESAAMLCDAAAEAFRQAREAFKSQWEALASQVKDAEAGAARTGVLLDMKRLCRESLLEELGNRAVLPSHGFPSDVVPFVNRCAETKERPRPETDGEDADARTRRYDYPTRKADVALREYAPGGEVVIDGLVWQSAGVTLNWQRPADAEAVKEIQSLRHFWQCTACGVADCGPAGVAECPACGEPVTLRERFLAPAGFRVEWSAKPHADTDDITYISPSLPCISARGAAWEPLLDPALGRGRATADGLVFHATRGSGGSGYRICLDCGRAAGAGGDEAWAKDHAPLWHGGKGAHGRCTGSDRPFAVTEPMALGYEVRTDVAEMQPAGLEDPGGAWALVSALRESLARRLGIETSELGMGVVRRRGALAGVTHSLFLFDTNPGGAGFATRLFDDLSGLFEEAERILDCQAPGCDRGCGACVLTADLFDQQDKIDRHAALLCVIDLRAGVRVPRGEDAALPDATLSRPVADAVVRRLSREDVLTLFSPDHFDLAALAAEPFTSLLAAVTARNATVRLALRPTTLAGSNEVQRFGLRDAAVQHGLALALAEATAAPNGAALLATLATGAGTTAWFTRDRTAAIIGASWGVGQDAAVVCGAMAEPVAVTPLDPASLLPRPTTAVLMIRDEAGRRFDEFAAWFATQLRGKLEPLALWRRGKLASLSYSDRYLRSPLTLALALHACAGLRTALAPSGARIPLRLVSAPPSAALAGQPYFLFHDWPRAADRDAVATRLAQMFGFTVALANDAPHWRELCLRYRDGAVAHLFLDRGFGYWQSRRDKFDFTASAEQQAQRLRTLDTKIAGVGATYIVMSAGPA